MKRRYDKLTNSGVKWLGDIPAHWQVKRGRFSMAVNPPLSSSSQLPPDAEVSFVPMEDIGERGDLNLKGTRLFWEVGAGYTPFQNGDVIVAKITPCFENGKGAIAKGLCNGLAFGTTELHVLRALPLLEQRFLFYLTLSSGYRRGGEAEMYGAGGQKRVPPEFNKNLRLPVPPLVEQMGIADFLDRKTAEIDSLVAKKHGLIEKLKGKRTVLISRTVTRGLPPEAARAAGLEPNLSFKSSGVEWLGHVPEHWNVKQLKWAVFFQRGHDLPGDQREDGNIPLISSAGRVATHSEAVAKGPGIVTGRYGTIGEFYLIEEDYWPLNTTLYSIDLRKNEPRFLQYMLNHLSPLFLLNAVKSAVPGIDRNDIHVVLSAIPPCSEQRAIADFLDRETAKLDALIGKVEQAIERLQEYRTALITAAVTGKIDVRRSKVDAVDRVDDADGGDVECAEVDRAGSAGPADRRGRTRRRGSSKAHG